MTKTEIKSIAVAVEYWFNSQGLPIVEHSVWKLLLDHYKGCGMTPADRTAVWEYLSK